MVCLGGSCLVSIVASGTVLMLGVMIGADDV